MKPTDELIDLTKPPDYNDYYLKMKTATPWKHEIKFTSDFIIDAYEINGQTPPAANFLIKSAQVKPVVIEFHMRHTHDVDQLQFIIVCTPKSLIVVKTGDSELKKEISDFINDLPKETTHSFKYGKNKTILQQKHNITPKFTDYIFQSHDFITINQIKKELSNYAPFIMDNSRLPDNCMARYLQAVTECVALQILLKGNQKQIFPKQEFVVQASNQDHSEKKALDKSPKLSESLEPYFDSMTTKCIFCGSIPKSMLNHLFHIVTAHQLLDSFLNTYYNPSTKTCLICKKVLNIPPKDKDRVLKHYAELHQRTVMNFVGDNIPKNLQKFQKQYKEWIKNCCKPTKPYICVMCDSEFPTVPEVLRHYLESHDFDQFLKMECTSSRCVVCPYVFKQGKSKHHDLLIHFSIKHPDTCIKVIRQHILQNKAKKFDEFIASLNIPQPGPFDCIFCPMRFDNIQKFLGHLLHKHGFQEDLLSEYNKSTNSHKYVCSICNNNLLSKEDFIYHFPNSHIDEIIQWTFEHFHDDLIEAHIKLIDITQPYIKQTQDINCILCSKKFNYMNTFILHLLNEHNFTDKMFQQYADISQNKCKCKMCDQFVSTQELLIKHMVYDHPNATITELYKLLPQEEKSTFALIGKAYIPSNVLHISGQRKISTALYNESEKFAAPQFIPPPSPIPQMMAPISNQLQPVIQQIPSQKQPMIAPMLTQQPQMIDQASILQQPIMPPQQIPYIPAWPYYQPQMMSNYPDDRFWWEIERIEKIMKQNYLLEIVDQNTFKCNSCNLNFETLTGFMHHAWTRHKI